MFLSRIESCVAVNVIVLLFSKVVMLCKSRTKCGQYRIWNEEVCTCIDLPVMMAPLKVEECKAGYYGVNCSQSCRYPNFGVDCQKECHCLKEFCNVRLGCVYENSTSDLPVMLTSLDIEKCKGGYYGLNCSQPCRYPNFGVDCQKQCSCVKEFCNVRLGCVHDNSTTVNHTTKWFQNKSEWTATVSKEVFIGALVLCGVLMVLTIYLLIVIYKKKCKSDQRNLSSYTGRFTAI